MKYNNIKLPNYITNALLEVIHPIFFRDTVISMIHDQLDSVIQKDVDHGYTIGR